jgi:hypothetical protein
MRTSLLDRAVIVSFYIVASPLFGATAPYTQGAAAGCVGTTAACDLLDLNPITPGGLAQINTMVGSAPLGTMVTLNASGEGGYGALHASASVFFNITGSPKWALDAAQGAFGDVVTIYASGLNGSPGLLNISYTLDGSIVMTGAANAYAVVRARGGTTALSTQRYTSSTTGTFSLPAPIGFTYGQPFELDFFLDANAGTLNSNDTRFAATGSGSGSADFTKTLVLSSLIPTDLDGNQVVGAQFTSASGTQYSTAGVVPEPSTFWPLILLCSAAIATGKRTRRRI